MGNEQHFLRGLARPEHVVGLSLGCGFFPKLGREMASILFQTPMTPAYILIKTISGVERSPFTLWCQTGFPLQLFQWILGSLHPTGYLSTDHQKVLVFCTVATGWCCCSSQENSQLQRCNSVHQISFQSESLAVYDCCVNTYK